MSNDPDEYYMFFNGTSCTENMSKGSATFDTDDCTDMGDHVRVDWGTLYLYYNQTITYDDWTCNTTHIIDVLNSSSNIGNIAWGIGGSSVFSQVYPYYLRADMEWEEQPATYKKFYTSPNFATTNYTLVIIYDTCISNVTFKVYNRETGTLLGSESGTYRINATELNVTHLFGSGSDSEYTYYGNARMLIGSDIISTGNPTITFSAPTDNNSIVIDRNWTFINISGNESIFNCTLTFDGTDYYMHNLSSTSFYYNITNQNTKNYSFSVTCNDSDGLTGTTTTEWVYIVNRNLDGKFMILWDNETIPSNWSCVSCEQTDPLYQRLIRSASTYGEIGGSSGHIHNVSYVNETTGSALDRCSTIGIDDQRATHDHVHNGFDYTSVSNESLLPPYKNLYILAYDYGIPQELPVNTILFFNDTSLPDKWVRLSDIDGRYIRGENNTDTGGSIYHTHNITANSNHEKDGGQGCDTGGSGITTSSDIHSHNNALKVTNWDETSHRPRTQDIIVAKLNTSIKLSDTYGYIAMFNTTAPNGTYTNLSYWISEYLRANSTITQDYASTGSHNHDNLANTTVTGSGTGTTHALGGDNTALYTHTHIFTGQFNYSTSNPPYIMVILGYKELENVAPNISILYPNLTLGDRINDFTGWINVTIQDTGGNCTFNDSRWDYQNGNASHFNFLNNTDLPNADYSIFIGCNDSEGESDTYTLNFTIDTINPIIHIFDPTNNSAYSTFQENFTYDLECSDLSPYLFNMSIFNSSNDLVFSIENDTTTANGTTLDLIGTLDISNYNSGNYTVNYSCSDSHTLKTWNPSYTVSPIAGGIDIVFDGTESIKVKVQNIEATAQLSSASLSSFSTTKEIDRLTFDLSFSQNIKKMEFLIEANSIQEIQNSNYKGHIILNNKYWFDTEPYRSTISINKGIATLTIENIDTPSLITNSLGGLNVESVIHNIQIDSKKPNATFKTQTPSDINSINILSTTLNITYNISDNIAINTSTIRFYQKTNKSTSDNVEIYINGTTKFQGLIHSNARQSNVGDVYQYLLSDNDIYPATYNYNQTLMVKYQKQAYELSNLTQYYSVRFFNVSNSKNYSFFEVMMNCSDTAEARITYCNSTYNFDSKPTTDDNCIEFASHSGNEYNHTHGGNSSHIVKPFVINNTGHIGDIYVTDTSYFIFSLVGGSGSCYLWSVSNVSRDDTVKYSENSGVSFTNRAETLDSHLHQYDGSDTFSYFAGVCDVFDNCYNSSIRSDILELGDFPPTAPDVFNPVNDSYTGNITINYTQSQPTVGDSIAKYNISLLNNSLQFVQTIVHDNSGNLSYQWNTSEADDGNYIIEVEACDTSNRCTSGYSQNFSIDNVVESYSTTTQRDVCSLYVDLINGQRHRSKNCRVYQDFIVDGTYELRVSLPITEIEFYADRSGDSASSNFSTETRIERKTSEIILKANATIPSSGLKYFNFTYSWWVQLEQSTVSPKSRSGAKKTTEKITEEPKETIAKQDTIIEQTLLNKLIESILGKKEGQEVKEDFTYSKFNTFSIGLKHDETWVENKDNILYIKLIDSNNNLIDADDITVTLRNNEGKLIDQADKVKRKSTGTYFTTLQAEQGLYSLEVTILKNQESGTAISSVNISQKSTKWYNPNTWIATIKKIYKILITDNIEGIGTDKIKEKLNSIAK